LSDIILCGQYPSKTSDKFYAGQYPSKNNLKLDIQTVYDLFY
jgi:hypothetical protein